MATHISEALPLDYMLSALPSLPRPLLARLTERLIDRLNELDGDPETEEDDHGEEDDWGGGNSEDEGEQDNRRDARPVYEIDQRILIGRFGPRWTHQ